MTHLDITPGDNVLIKFMNEEDVTPCTVLESRRVRLSLKSFGTYAKCRVPGGTERVALLYESQYPTDELVSILR